jgi:hypothetical protein
MADGRLEGFNQVAGTRQIFACGLGEALLDCIEAIALQGAKENGDEGVLLMAV